MNKKFIAVLGLAVALMTGFEVAAVAQGVNRVPQAGFTVDNNGSAFVNGEGNRATYRYSQIAFSMVATPTDVIVIQGSATKTCRVKYVRLGGVATANGNMQVLFIRRSTAGTLGSAVLTAVTAAKHDIGDPSATCVVSTVGTANYTSLGTAAGTFRADRLFLPTTATGTPQQTQWEFADNQDKPVVLRGTSDFVVVNMNGSAIPAGGVLDFEIEVEEDNS